MVFVKIDLLTGKLETKSMCGEGNIKVTFVKIDVQHESAAKNVKGDLCQNPFCQDCQGGLCENRSVFKNVKVPF